MRKAVFFNPAAPLFSKKRRTCRKKTFSALHFPRDGVWYCSDCKREGNGIMSAGQQMHLTHSSARLCPAAAGMLFFVLLLNLVLTMFAPPPESSAFAVSKAFAPQSPRIAAEHSGNLAAMHDGAGNGVQVQMRGGRTSPTFARRLQTEAARFNPARASESVPNRPDRIGTPAQTFLFQLFPRCFLPVRAGPIPA